MSGHTENAESARAPDLSLVMPCYNEEMVATRTIDRLIAAFGEAGHTLEVVAVDNGSDDGTLGALHDCADRHREVSVVRVARNRGYGYGVLTGLPHGRAPWL
ncbi:MAG: glycosyltransferase, partial [Halobacteriales archaeon]|nr:glycosyltransferase [Halobacteriales archaeon]